MAQPHTADERHRQIARAGLITIAANIGITAARLAAGLLSGSTAVMADAVNSGTDIFATMVVLGGSRVAAQPPDSDHPFGHEKAEPVAAKIVGIFVTVTGVVTALSAWRALHAGVHHPIGLAATGVMALSVVAKELMARYLIDVGKATQNQAMLADAANQRTDVITSIAALVGTLGGRLGVPALDPAMGLLVAGLIVRMGLGLYWRSVSELMDPAPAPEAMAALGRAVASVSGVIQVDEVRARTSGSGIHVDCKICVDGRLTVAEGHRIAGRVKEALGEAVPGVRWALVHVNPCVPPGAGDRPADGAHPTDEVHPLDEAPPWVVAEPPSQELDKR